MSRRQAVLVAAGVTFVMLTGLMMRLTRLCCAPPPSGGDETPAVARLGAASDPGGAGGKDVLGEVEWEFIPTPGERAALDSALRRLLAEPGLPELVADTASPPMLLRFTTDDAPGRYLLFSARTAAGQGARRRFRPRLDLLEHTHGEWRLAHVTLEAGQLAYPLRWHDDRDGDGRADVVYCYRIDARDPHATPRALGVRDAKWYRIELPARQLGLCS
jgi:hypothetical protein